MLPKDLTKDVKNRLKSLSGQIEGIARMLDEEQSPKNILLQMKAAEKALHKAHHILLDEVYRKTLAIQIVNAAEACPGNCGNEDKIESLRKQFPDLQPEQLADKIQEVRELYQWLSDYLKTQQNQ